MVMMLEQLLLSLISIFVVIFTGLYFYFSRNYNFWKEIGIPYVKPVPFLGTMKDLVLLKIGIGEHLQKIYDNYNDKPYVGIFSFDRPTLVICDLDIVKNILVKDAQYFIDRVITFNERLDPLFGKTMFTLKGQRWRHIRVNLTPVFTSGKMKMMFCLVKNCAGELSHYLDREMADGKCVHLQKCTIVLWM
jgi:cytochrome P450 family 6